MTKQAKVKAWTKEQVANAAKAITAAGNKSRGLLQDATIGVIAHMGEHGDYTVVYPLVEAANSLGRNLFNSWIGYVEAHSWLRYNKQGLRGRALVDKAATSDGIKELISRQANMKKERNTEALEVATAPKLVGRDKREAPNVWWTYKKPTVASDEVPEFDIEARCNRFFGDLQKAIDAGTVRHESKNYRLAQVQEYLTERTAALVLNKPTNVTHLEDVKKRKPAAKKSAAKKRTRKPESETGTGGPEVQVA